MKNAEFLFVKSDPQAAEDALSGNGDKGGDPEPAQPAPFLADPEPDHQHQREHPDTGGDEAMGMFVENASDPFRDGKQKHVVPVARGPIRNGHAGAMTGDEAAQANEE